MASCHGPNSVISRFPPMRRHTFFSLMRCYVQFPDHLRKYLSSHCSTYGRQGQKNSFNLNLLRVILAVLSLSLSLLFSIYSKLQWIQFEPCLSSPTFQFIYCSSCFMQEFALVLVRAICLKVPHWKMHFMCENMKPQSQCALFNYHGSQNVHRSTL